jgi:hypothetical protein
VRAGNVREILEHCEELRWMRGWRERIWELSSCAQLRQISDTSMRTDGRQKTIHNVSLLLRHPPRVNQHLLYITSVPISHKKWVKKYERHTYKNWSPGLISPIIVDYEMDFVYIEGQGSLDKNLYTMLWRVTQWNSSRYISSPCSRLRMH